MLIIAHHIYTTLPQILVQKFVSEDLKLQVSVLYATQVFCHDKHFPKGKLAVFVRHCFVFSDNALKGGLLSVARAAWTVNGSNGPLRVCLQS